jgi:AbrB family looped-hinge helix DNA binding protein
METTKLSSKGQIIIPKGIRAAHQWEAGLELQVIDMGDGVLLRPKAPFAEAVLDDVAGLLKNRVRPKTERDIQSALAQGIRDKWRDRN